MRAESSPPVAPGPQFDFASIQVMPPAVQRKATISSTVASYERRVDEMGDKLMQRAEPGLIGPSSVAIQRECAACEDEENTTIHGKRAPPERDGPGLDTASAVRAAEHGGAPLPREVRSLFEPRFGHDFSQVRIHADGEAASAARAVRAVRAVRARAYTIGRHIVFGARQYQPATTEGKLLLAHELTHVVQQTGGRELAHRKASEPSGPERARSQDASDATVRLLAK